MRGIQHMQVYKHRLNRKGGIAARRGYQAPDKPDVMMVVGNELVLDSKQARPVRFAVVMSSTDASVCNSHQLPQIAQTYLRLHR